jgi:DNA primase
MISQRTIEEVKERANLLEIAGEFVKLRRQGSSYVGCCPFHAEKTGSFHIRDNGKFYHCFGCGVSGSAITFIMEARGLAFPDAVEELATRYGVRVEHDKSKVSGSKQPEREKFYKLNQVAQEFFLREASSAPTSVHHYLNKRGLTHESLREFGVGFAPVERNKLLSFLRSKGAPDELVLASGLVRRSARGELYDSFRGRLVFPIFVERRQIAGFGGRILPDLVPAEALASAPKYLNSPETAVYEKSKILYGLPHALESVRRSRELYLVEGYMDVIGLWQAGVRNVAATCGTAVTENHARRLAHLVQRVVLLFDGDSAGINAAGKSYAVFINSGIDCSAVFLPDGEDPDTIALRYGAETSNELKKLRSVPLLDCYVEFLIRKHGAKDAREMGAAAKGKVATEVAETLARIKNEIERAAVIERAALKLMIEPKAMHQLVGDIRSDSAKTAGSVGADDKRSTANLRGVEKESAPTQRIREIKELSALDREVLMAVVLKRGEFVERVLHSGVLCEVLAAETRDFITALSRIVSQGAEDQQKRAVQRLLGQFGESWKSFWIQAHEMHQSGELDLEALYRGCVSSALRLQFNQQVKALEWDLQNASEDEDRARIAQELLQLQRRGPGQSGTAS